MSARRFLIAIAIPVCACGTVHATDFPVNHAVPDAQLDTIRGGFDVSGLRVSLGLERTVLINGIEAIRQSVNIPDVSQMTADQATALKSVLGTTVVTNGVGGVTTAQMVPASSNASTNAAQASQSITLPSSLGLPSGSAAGLVVQNSLDNQAITATTTIDASVNTAHMLQNIRVDEAIKDAVIQFRGN
ncbi:hypothetical protein FIV34_05325 [Luteibacter pinisoli]|uniref:Uncharacterized protein n=1 Tax=Luteibacter pinisoli TaxID=2589080 RepID=A0A4Y5Z0Q8_9GAMM|nr:hypothetical protein [Luteibacter pinisoli]QDE38664.1 hypothetical protein FIV34_05325 [Luteibacter pinisoli]